jgi:hypothetical protein
MSKLIYCNIILLLLLIHIIIQFIISRMDYVILMYLIFNKIKLLSKYRDYFPLCHYIPYSFDKMIFICVYIFYIPIVILYTIISYLMGTGGSLSDNISFYLKHPLMFSKGMVYNGILPYFYCLKSGIELNDNTFNKLSWNTLFNDNNIPTPRILAYINNGVIENIDKSSGCNYECDTIIKPINGSCGNEVMLFDKDNIPMIGMYIIQERIKSDDIMKNKSISFRIITNCVNNDISLWDVYMLVGDGVATNMSQGGGIYKFIKDKNRFVDNTDVEIKLNIKDNRFLQRAIKDAIKCHNNLIFCPTIGWDVIINREGYYFLEGNIGVPTFSNLDEEYKKNEYIEIISGIYNKIMR